jgi:hypothetical protein
VAGTCECGNEPSGSIKCGKIFDYLRDCSLFKKGGVAWNWLVWEVHRFVQKSRGHFELWMPEG